jgi:hypothetical protein
MTTEDREDRLVVTPLIDWLKKQKPGWIIDKPKYPTSARGWDIEARRRNEYLLIEAKYIAGPAIAAFAGLVAAPLAKRALRLNIPALEPWCCWAIGINPPGPVGSEVRKATTRNMYQILFDYMARNSKFWKHYGKDLRMKYIFFVQKEEVTSILFTEFLRMTKLYTDRAHGKRLKERRQIAEDLLVLIRFPAST